MSTILLPTDGSLPALAATHRAVAMAKQLGADLVVLKVVEQRPIIQIEKAAEDQALKRPEGEDGVEYAKELAAEAKVPYKIILREGPVVGEILRVADETGADHIIMGTSSLKGFNRLYLGSVAKSVVNQSPVSVMVVKPTPEETKSLKARVKEVITPSPAKAVAAIMRTKQFRVGVYLFLIYTIGYGLFTIAGSYFRDFFGNLFLGMNVGTVTGIILILVTIFLAIGFNWYANRAEERA